MRNTRNHRRLRPAIGVLICSAWLFGFRPFSAVKNVCPSCPPPEPHVVVLRGGESVSCNVVGANSEFFVLEKLGEFRAAARPEIAALRRRPGTPVPRIEPADQVLLKNGLVLQGTIAEEHAGRYVIIQIGTQRHVAWFSQIASVQRRPSPGSADQDGAVMKQPKVPGSAQTK